MLKRICWLPLQLQGVAPDPAIDTLHFFDIKVPLSLAFVLPISNSAQSPQVFNMFLIALLLLHLLTGAVHAQGARPNSSTLFGAWKTAQINSGNLVRRHEACAVMVKGLVVLVGGRGVNKAVSIYNPKTGVWVNKAGPGSGIEIHHFQCVAIQRKIWIISSWTGGFPFERNNAKIFIYDVANDTWETKDGLPEPRRRGGGACIRVKNLIYLIGGNRGGHGEHATSLSWVDAYNFRKDRWITGLPSMPAAAARDHVGGAMVRNELCIAGGRDGGVARFFDANSVSTYCYNIATRTWRRAADFPEPRAGAMTGRTCDGRMMVAGGEGDGKAFKRVDVFNGRKWRRAPDLARGRHGSGLAIAKCKCGHIFIPSGSGGQGGGPELFETEQFVPAGRMQTCAKF